MIVAHAVPWPNGARFVVADRYAVRGGRIEFHEDAADRRSDVELAPLGYIAWFNCRRLHSEIGDIPPVEFEAAYYRQINQQELIET